MSSKFTISQFLKRFPNDEACLEEIKSLRWPYGITCPQENKITKFYKVKNRTAYACSSCGTHVYPLADTIFEKTTTPLRLWFYAIYLMAQTRAGISAKQLERELGVTYKTAWRMFKQIRSLMADTSTEPLDGTVEIDETYIGGKAKNRAKKWVQGIDSEQKEIIMGMAQRNGRVYLKHIPNTGKWTLLKQIQDHVDPKATVYTDHLLAYKQLKKFGFNHSWVNHQKEFARGDVYTQNIENFWSHLKRGITGVYRHVSKKYLQAYVDEYGFRYSNRDAGGDMFDRILRQVPEVKVIQT